MVLLYFLITDVVHTNNSHSLTDTDNKFSRNYYTTVNTFILNHVVQSEPNLELFGLRRVLNTLQFNYKVEKCLSRSAKFMLLNKHSTFQIHEQPLLYIIFHNSSCNDLQNKLIHVYYIYTISNLKTLFLRLQVLMVQFT